MSASSDDVDFVLPRGVTGFSSNRDTPVPATDADRFHADAFRVVEKLPARIVESTSCRCGPGNNYHSVEIYIGRQNVIAMLNAVHPLIGYAFEQGDSLIFIDQTQLASGFAVFGRYEVLSDTVLNREISSNDTSALATAEIDQMRYWKPRTIGEVIFNRWD